MEGILSGFVSGLQIYTSRPELIPQVLMNGLMSSLLYVLIALGLTLSFSIMGIINFAHGEFYMLGAYVLLMTYFDRLMGVMDHNLAYFIAMVVSAVTVGVIGIVIERYLFRPFKDNPLSGLVVTLGVALLLQNGAQFIWTRDDRNVPAPLSGVFHIFGAVFAKPRVLIIVVAIVVVILLQLFIQKTKSGQAMRAVAQDPDAAALQGMDINSTRRIAFGIGCGLAAIAGSLVAPIFVINPHMGAIPVFKGFAVIILGGMGSIPGVLLGGGILGFVESFTATSFGSISAMIFFVVIVLVLIFKPTGLLGHE